MFNAGESRQSEQSLRTKLGECERELSARCELSQKALSERSAEADSLRAELSVTRQEWSARLLEAVSKEKERALEVCIPAIYFNNTVLYQ